MKKLFLLIVLNLVVAEASLAQENLIPNSDFEEYDILLPIDYTNPAMPCEWGEKIHFDSLKQQPAKENLIEAGSCPILLLNKAGAVYSLCFGAKFFLPKWSLKKSTYLRGGYLVTCDRPEIFYDAEKRNLRRHQYFNIGVEKYFSKKKRRVNSFWGVDFVYDYVIDTKGVISSQSYYYKLEGYSFGLGLFSGIRYSISPRIGLGLEIGLATVFAKEKNTTVIGNQKPMIDIHHSAGGALFRPGTVSVYIKY